ncbi:MAG TPA: hypothetical protein VFF88_02585 [Methylocella sp.]|nr:hypothetical protein [Methylocella sp.]
MKTLWPGLLFALAGTLPGLAGETREPRETPLPRQRPSELLNEKYLAPTGATVPHPGESQGAPTSPLDRDIEQQNDQIDRSICSNCN